MKIRKSVNVVTRLESVHNHSLIVFGASKAKRYTDTEDDDKVTPRTLNKLLNHSTKHCDLVVTER